MTTTPAGQGPLWSDDKIYSTARAVSRNSTTQATVRSCLLQMRYDYESRRRLELEEIAHSHSQLAAANERIAELEETLAFAAQYHGYEARACPLCKYEDGEFVEACQMHKDMDAQQAQIEALRAQLAEWQLATCTDYDIYTTTDLPDDLRLMRRVEPAKEE